MKRIGSSIFIAVLMAAAFAHAGQIRLDATVDQNEVEEGDNLTLTLTLTSDQNISDEDEPRLPTLDGFELLNKWTQSEASSVFENGKFSFIKKQIYKYTLSPQKAGTLKIGSATINVNGQSLTSQPITIKVTPAGQGGNVAKKKKQRQQAPDEEDMGQPPGFPDDDEDDLFSQLLRRRGLLPNGRGGIRSQPKVDQKDAFFIAVEANKQKAYVGEEIVVNWYLYTRGSITAFDALKYPDLKGFWKEDLEMATRLNFSQEVVNGIPYNKALLVSYALFPISPGQKIIDSYKAKATVVEMDSGLSMFGIGHPYSYVKASKDLPIQVLPLPAEGRPTSFSGAVGKFNVTGSLSSTTAKVNQPVSLKIRFSGEGNVKAIELPPLELPKSLEVYDTKKDSQFNKDGQGYKEFEVLIIPRSQGEVTIPPIAVSYFDPKAAKYVSSTTPAFNLKVLPGDGQPNNFSAPMSNVPQANQAANNKDLRYLKTSPGFALPPKVLTGSWLALFLAVYGWFGWQIFRIVSGRELDSAARTRKRVRAKLKAAQLKLKAGDWKGVGVESSNAVLSTLGEVSGSGGVALTTDEMMARLPKESQPLQARIGKFLNRCEIVSFAPKELAEQLTTNGGGELNKIVGEAEAIISDLFELAKREKSGSPGAASSAGQRTS